MVNRIPALLAGFLILGYGLAFAQQQATVVGVVMDDTKAVLPGVTVTATDLETGRQHVAVTDAQGNYRLVNLPPATYRIQAELAGFSSVVVPRVELLVGQNATLPFTLRVATVEETVTVTGEAPLIRHDIVAGHGQRGPAPDGGAADSGPQLDGARQDGAGHHGQ